MTPIPDYSLPAGWMPALEARNQGIQLPTRRSRRQVREENSGGDGKSKRTWFSAGVAGLTRQGQADRRSVLVAK